MQVHSKNVIQIGEHGPKICLLGDEQVTSNPNFGVLMDSFDYIYTAETNQNVSEIFWNKDRLSVHVTTTVQQLCALASKAKKQQARFKKERPNFSTRFFVHFGNLSFLFTEKPETKSKVKKQAKAKRPKVARRKR